MSETRKSGEVGKKAMIFYVSVIVIPVALAMLFLALETTSWGSMITHPQETERCQKVGCAYYSGSGGTNILNPQCMFGFGCDTRPLYKCCGCRNTNACDYFRADEWRAIG